MIGRHSSSCSIRVACSLDERDDEDCSSCIVVYSSYYRADQHSSSCSVRVVYSSDHRASEDCSPSVATRLQLGCSCSPALLFFGVVCESSPAPTIAQRRTALRMLCLYSVGVVNNSDDLAGEYCRYTSHLQLECCADEDVGCRRSSPSAA